MPRVFFGINGTYIYCVVEWNRKPSTMVGACHKFFKSLEWPHYLKMKFSAGLRSLYKNCYQKIVKFAQYLGNHTDLTIWIYLWLRHRKFQQATLLLVQWLFLIICHIYWETFNWNFSNGNGVNVQWIHPGSISDSEKNLMWLTVLRKNGKSCQIKGSLNISCQKNNPVFRSWRSY